MKSVRDAATLLILILLAISVRIGPVDDSVDLVPQAHAAEAIQVLPAHDNLPACTEAERRSEQTVTHTSTSLGLPASCRS
jgi:hypothetical protein